MTFNELKAEASKMGFQFELQSWIPDDYWEDEDGKKHNYTQKVSAWKVTFPDDYPRPAHWIDEDDDPGKARSLQHAIDEYNNKEAIYAEDQRKSDELKSAMGKMKQFFGKHI